MDARYAVFEAFAKEKIEFAYPTQTLFAANTFVDQHKEKSNGSINETFEKVSDSFVSKS